MHRHKPNTTEAEKNSRNRKMNNPELYFHIQQFSQVRISCVLHYTRAPLRTGLRPHLKVVAELWPQRGGKLFNMQLNYIEATYYYYYYYYDHY